MPAAATVLIADDEASPREKAAYLLRQHGFRVLIAADGVQALAVCRRERPDLLLLDMIMPHMDGIGVCRALRGDPLVPYIPIIFYSRRDATADKVAGLRAGGDDFVGKEISDDELIARVEAHLRVKRLVDSAGRGTGTAKISPAASGSALAPPEALEQRLADEFAGAVDNNEPLSLVLISVGDDEGGGLASDVRAELEAKITTCARASDLVARCRDIGYAILLPNTHFGGAMAIAESAWKAVPPTKPERAGDDRAPFPGLSIGVACYPNPAIGSGPELHDIARAALTRAQAEGPAHICLFHHQAYLFRPDE